MENIGATRIEDVPVLDTRERLKADPIAVVWMTYARRLGVRRCPDLSGLGRDVMLIAWQTFPDNQVAPEFADWLDAALRARDVERDEQVFHLPLRRRSRMAAEANGSGGVLALPERGGRLRGAN